MTPTEFLETYGYAAVLAGALMQAETVLLLAGFAAHRGHLSLEIVLLLGALGGAAGAQGFFWVGRRWAGLLRHAPRIQRPMLRMIPLLRRWDAALVFGVRFLYGLRIAGPIAMGALGVDARRFAALRGIQRSRCGGVVRRLRRTRLPARTRHRSAAAPRRRL
jgi:membrane protein DedA with SNARE-associated domain